MTARTRAAGPPARPCRGREWSLYPALGTRSASMPEAAPTNSTDAPLARRLSATHSAGIACPPVPPPAIRTRGGAWFDFSGSLTILRYPVQHPYGREADQHARSPVAHERQGHAGQWEHAHRSPYIEDSLGRDRGGQPSGQATSQNRWRME